MTTTLQIECGEDRNLTEIFQQGVAAPSVNSNLVASGNRV